MERSAGGNGINTSLFHRKTARRWPRIPAQSRRPACGSWSSVLVQPRSPGRIAPAYAYARTSSLRSLLWPSTATRRAEEERGPARRQPPARISCQTRCVSLSPDRSHDCRNRRGFEEQAAPCAHNAPCAFRGDFDRARDPCEQAVDKGLWHAEFGKPYGIAQDGEVALVRVERVRTRVGSARPRRSRRLRAQGASAGACR